MIVMNSFGELLTKIRMRLAVTQEGLAALCRINIGRIDGFERNRVIPKRKEFYSIIRALNLDGFDSDHLCDLRGEALVERSRRK
jgi:transcriptional regulator with XRE-family HTH domain